MHIHQTAVKKTVLFVMSRNYTRCYWGQIKGQCGSAPLINFLLILNITLLFLPLSLFYFISSYFFKFSRDSMPPDPPNGVPAFGGCMLVTPTCGHPPPAILKSLNCSKLDMLKRYSPRGQSCKKFKLYNFCSTFIKKSGHGHSQWFFNRSTASK